ncbi:hypothetical protein KUCAC02_025761 [Chaenocephalus aceratus]|uniref:Uncharacterized protein n=1 Tax=Chaenocephalus aceratus TaxID=36190 RepID=A0ACB9VVI8_CHAAC|nr:hypothetical protein KUCAC02_025761 [Chaenocephalus aceratus]
MNSLPKGHLAGCALLLLVFLLDSTFGQAGEQCLAQFKRGKEDFVLDGDESVKDGATFISSPPINSIQGLRERVLQRAGVQCRLHGERIRGRLDQFLLSL